jgi:ABC-type amino acid transport substrate-binding protein
MGAEVLTFLRKAFRRGLLYAVFFAFSLGGCSLYIAHEVAGPSPPPRPEAPPASGALLKSELRVGISPDYVPLAFKDPTFGLVGIEVDFANQLGNELGKKIIFVERPFPQLIQALLAEDIDIIMSGMSVTEERARLVSFTNSYADISQMALVRSKDAAAFPNVQAFLNVTSKVGYVETTTGEKAARAFFPQAALAPQPSIDAGVAALRAGDIAVFIHDAPTVWRIAGSGNKDLQGLYWALTKEQIAWAVRKEDEPLRFAVNEALQRMDFSGRRKEILSRWVPLRIW